MAAYGWKVSSRCWKCGARRPVDLIDVGKRLGPQYSLWDRAARCKQITGCWGLVTFSARPPGTLQDVHLCSPPIRERRAVLLDQACKEWLARQPNPEDPQNFGG